MGVFGFYEIPLIIFRFDYDLNHSEKEEAKILHIVDFKGFQKNDVMRIFFASVKKTQEMIESTRRKRKKQEGKKDDAA